MSPSCRILVSTLLAVGILLTASGALAVTCTITGTAAVEPLDGYYCDTTHVSNCGGWYETNLDAARGANARRMPYMRVEIWQGSTYLAKTHTSWNGTYSVTFALPGTSCAGQAVTVQHWMERIHESDLNVWPPRYRYSIVVFESGKAESQMLTIWKLNAAVTLTGSSTSVAVTVAADASLASRVANMYFIANSAMTQVATWSTRISDHFANTSGASNGIFRIVYGPDNPGAGGGTNVWDWNVVLGYDTYNRGMILRHEIGMRFGRPSTTGSANSWAAQRTSTTSSMVTTRKAVSMARQR